VRVKTGWVMSGVRSASWYGFRGSVLGLVAVTSALLVSGHPADAWHRRHHGHVRWHGRHHVARAERYSPPSASIVVDGHDGNVLEASHPDALRHPASLTKIMTLYLLFERLDAGKISLDTPLKVSEHAADQAPTKLGLKPGQSIAVEDAIKAVVTRSANDAAVTIAENLGGSEQDFARLMTQKARALGMSRTTYVNASGLPDDDQNTTARDQATLGRAIQARFPQYYRYFATRQFVYHGTAIRNHNHLLGEVGGVDGIKTGYTNASGFNLVTSVHRDGRFIVAVVFGGRSASQRDAQMRSLIGAHIRQAQVAHARTSVAETMERRSARSAAFASDGASADTLAETRAKQSSKTASNKTSSNKFAKTPLIGGAEAPSPASANRPTTVGSSAPIQPVMVKTITYRTAPVKDAPLAPMPALVPTAGAPAQATSEAATRRPMLSAPIEAPARIVASAVPSAETAIESEPAKLPAAEPETAKPEAAKAEPPAAKPHPRGGWLIQVGAFEQEAEAKEHLTLAKTKVPGILAAADPFTERVQKGAKSFYRARFAGLDREAAEAACKLLRRNDVACLAMRN
jgi:D-alanyl-D-alanine carboxypeptidase